MKPKRTLAAVPPRRALIDALTADIARLTRAGDLVAASIAADALARLLAAGTPGTVRVPGDVIDLADRRLNRGGR